MLERGGQVAGRLVDSEGRAVAGGRISVVELSGQPAPRALSDLLRAEAGSDGRFLLASLPSGDHTLTAVYSPKSHRSSGRRGGRIRRSGMSREKRAWRYAVSCATETGLRSPTPG